MDIIDVACLERRDGSRGELLRVYGDQDGFDEVLGVGLARACARARAPAGVGVVQVDGAVLEEEDDEVVIRSLDDSRAVLVEVGRRG